MPTFIVVPYRYLVGLSITQVWDRIVYCNTLHQFQKVSKSQSAPHNPIEDTKRETRPPDRSAGTRPPDPPSGNQKSDPPAPHPCLKTKILGHAPRIYADLTIFSMFFEVLFLYKLILCFLDLGITG